MPIESILGVINSSRRPIGAALRKAGCKGGWKAEMQIMICRQLAKRFGPMPAWASERLCAMTAAEMLQICDRIFDAASIEEYFK